MKREPVLWFDRWECLTCVDEETGFLWLSCTKREPNSTAWWEREHEKRKLLKVDVNSVDKVYWHQVKSFLFWISKGLNNGQEWAKSAYKELRRVHFKCKEKHSFEIVGKKIANWAEDQIYKIIEEDDLECADAFRVAMKRKRSQVKRFQRERSCCGISEWSEVCPIDGEEYLLGCNHGH